MERRSPSRTAASPRCHRGLWTSLPFGVVTLAERFGKASVEGHQFEEMVAFIQTALKPFNERNTIAAKIKTSGARPALGASAPSPPSRAFTWGFPKNI